MIATNIIQETRTAGTKLLNILANPKKLETSLLDGSFKEICQKFADGHNIHHDAFEANCEQIMKEEGHLAQGQFRKLCINANRQAVHYSCGEMPAYEVIDKMKQLVDAPKRLDYKNEETLIGLAERFTHIAKNPKENELFFTTDVISALNKLRTHSHNMEKKQLINSCTNLSETFEKVISDDKKMPYKTAVTSLLAQIQKAKLYFQQIPQKKLIKTLREEANKMPDDKLIGTASRVSEQEKTKRSFLTKLRDFL